MARMYRFSTSLPYLLTRVGVRMGDLFSRELARDGLTLPMYRVLAVLAEEGCPQRLGDLAGLVSAETSTLSRLIGEMQRRGLVTRDRPATDQRTIAVALTPCGARTIERLIPRAASYEDLATGTMSEADARKLKLVLNQIYGNLTAVEVDELRLAERSA